MNMFEMLKLGLALEGKSDELELLPLAPAPGKGDGDDDGDDGDDDDGDDGDDGYDDDGDDDGDGGGGDDREAEDDGEAGDREDGEGGEGGDGAGGTRPEEGETFDPQTFAAALLAAMAAGDESGVKDLAAALAEAVIAAGEVPASPDEAVWRPYTTANDKVRVVPSGPEAREAGRKLQESVRREVSFLRARLRNKFLEAKAPRVMHGVRRGESLSERRLADTWIEVQSGIVPTRPDTRTVRRDAVTVAVAVVVDQSGSMSSRKTAAARALTAICTPLDEVGCPVLAVGFRAGYGGHSRGSDKGTFHRFEPVDIDIFKGWDEPVRNCLGRFTQVKATGGTPMSDGIQFALQALSARKERHRILLVITDGDPDYGHDPVIRRQQRLAEEAGIAIVGVGIDNGCYSVTQLYKRHVVVEDVGELPTRLLAVVDGIVFPRGPSRKVAIDGAMNTRVGR